MSMFWYVAQTGGGKERLAQRDLADRGLESFLPVFAGRYGARLPLFRGYVFAAFDAATELRRAMAARGVVRFLGGEEPEPLRDGVIGELMGRVGPDGLVSEPGEALAAAFRMAVGCTYQLSSGPLAGFVGECVESQERRAKLLLYLLGGKNAVYVPHGWVDQTPLAGTPSERPTAGAAAMNRDSRRYGLSVKGR